MSAPELTKEEVEVLRDRTQHTFTIARWLEYPYKNWGKVKKLAEEQLRLFATFDAVQRERDEAVKDGLRLTVELEQRTAQVQALEAERYFLYEQATKLARDRDALRAEVEDVRSQLAQRRISVPFPYQRDAPYKRKEP